MSLGPSTMGPTSRDVLPQKEQVVTFRPRNPLPPPPLPEPPSPPPILALPLSLPLVDPPRRPPEPELEPDAFRGAGTRCTGSDGGDSLMSSSMARRRRWAADRTLS